MAERIIKEYAKIWGIPYKKAQARLKSMERDEKMKNWVEDEKVRLQNR